MGKGSNAQKNKRARKMPKRKKQQGVGGGGAKGIKDRQGGGKEAMEEAKRIREANKKKRKRENEKSSTSSKQAKKGKQLWRSNFADWNVPVGRPWHSLSTLYHDKSTDVHVDWKKQKNTKSKKSFIKNGIFF